MSEEKNQEYIVEKILEKKKIGGVWKYKVKWEEYTEEECTWEPRENLKNVKYLIEEFEEKNKEKTKSENQSLLKNKTKRKNSLKDDDVSKSVSVNSNEKRSLIANGANFPTKITQQGLILENEIPKTYENVENKINENNITILKNENTEITLKGTIESDIPQKIINAKILDDLDININCLVKWKPRQDGYVPEPDWISSKLLKSKYPLVLFEFYESRIKFPKKDSK